MLELTPYNHGAGGEAPSSASHESSGRGRTSFEELCSYAEPGRTKELIAAGALPVFLRALTSENGRMQRIALRALLALILGARDLPGPMSAVLETVLGMSFLKGSLQALQLLNTLAAQPHCAARLLEPDKFEGILAVVDIQTDHGEFNASTQALRVIDAVLLHGANAGTLDNDHIVRVIETAERVGIAANGVDEAALEAAVHTVGQAQRLMHPTDAMASGAVELGERFKMWMAKNLQSPTGSSTPGSSTPADGTGTGTPGTPQGIAEARSAMRSPSRRLSDSWRRLSNV